MVSYLALFFAQESTAQTAADYGIQLEAVVQTAPPKINLSWRKIPGATNYTLQRKTKTASGWTALATTADSFYTDVTVVSDSAYEYKVFNTGGTSVAAGYIYAGINAPAIHNKGTLILIVDTLFRDSCAIEVKNLMKDLNADGWSIVRYNASRTTPDSLIKKTIKQYYNSIPEVNAVLILGHIAVPYSGEIAPDGHTNHIGAWPADVFYGDMDGNWSDLTVNNSSASRVQNKNIPNDGKWDQSNIPSQLELQVSRIDFANMPLFAKSEVAMMKSYLYKAHKYKMDSIYVSKVGLIDDNFGAFSGEAFAANAWRNFPQLVGRSNIKSVDFIATLNDSAYQWAYGCGGGSYTSCSGVGTTTNFTTKNQKGIFAILFGSYFGDWDSQDNFLRAPLCCNEPALTSCWAGRPNWFFHHMGLGENIGYSTKLTQNNGSGLYSPWGATGASGVHVALMGDLSLRTDYIKPAKNISITSAAKKGAVINWIASPDAAVIGYYLYRADSLYGKYSKRSGLIASTTFKDTIGKDGLYYYMVRPCKLETNPSGTYYNLGLGITDTATVSFPIVTSITTVPNTIIDLICFPNPAKDMLNIYCNLNTNKGALGIRIIDISGRTISYKTQEITQNEITVSEQVTNLASDTYQVLISLDNRRLSTLKFIKQ
jgi:hypothetical protein